MADNTSVAGPAGYFRAGGTMTNCIVTANSNAEDDGAPSSDANIAGTAEAAMTSCFTGDPLFNLGRKRGQPWYGLRDAFPCVNAGVPLGWMDANATDLAGNRRRIGLPDIGCYESQPRRPTCLMVQ